MNVFNLLTKPIRRLIEERNFKEPTEPQEKAIPLILEGLNVLLISPTATGKTEAAILPILSMLIQSPERGQGIKALYITPLRALNRDMLERLEWWCNRLDLKLAIRHGDTETKERSRQARSPPDILITTPETLQAIMPGWVMRQHLRHVKYVVVDEVHEMADNKRGSQLSLALERLRWITGHDFQLIGLSATIGSPEKVAKFLVGNDRDVEIVKVSAVRQMKFKIIYPKPEPGDFQLASKLYTHPEVAARLRVIRELIEKHKSVLLFTNTRSISEVLASRFRVWDSDFPVSIHHGSLAKPSRIAAERGLKNGELRGLVCTSSLELGIDVGRLDMVIPYMSPRQVTRLVQRVGRSGHRIGRIANGVIITMDPDDTLEAMVIARMTLEEKLEPVDIPPKPYDALVHQIAGLLIRKKRWYFYEIYDLFRKAYPYHDLNLEDVEKVLNYMYSRFPRLAWISKEDQLAIKPRRTKALYEYYFENLSMIPDEKRYIVIDDKTGSAVGILDEAFVAEYGKIGVKFIIRGSPWRIIGIQADKIYVQNVSDPTGAIPSWIGEEIPVPYEVAQEVGWIMRQVEEKVVERVALEEIASELSEVYPADRDTVQRAIEKVYEHVKAGYPVPSDKRMVIEDWEDFVIIHAHLGSLTNRALAQLIGELIAEDTGYFVTVQHDPYRIFIQTMGTINAEKILEIFKRIKRMNNFEIEEILTKAVRKTGIFKRRIVHVARRFGALKKWADFSRVSLRNLLKSFEGTVIYEEALKEVFTKDIAADTLLKVAGRLRSGDLEVIKLDTGGEATPIAQVGIEKVSMKTDIIPPEKMKFIIIESAKARLLNETRTFLCTNCWEYVDMITLKDLPDRPKCPKCGSPRLGMLREDEEEVLGLIEKKGGRLTKKERHLKELAEISADLISMHGKGAAVALAGRGLRAEDVKDILLQEDRLTNDFFERIVEAERNALKRAFSWK